MKQTLDALEKPNFKAKYKDLYPGVPVDDFKNESGKFVVKNTKTNCFPIIGSGAIALILEQYDKAACHQGVEAMISFIKKDKLEIYLQEGENYEKINDDARMIEVLKNLHKCLHCDTVEQLKKKGVKKGRLYELTEEDDIEEALKFGDLHHAGKLK